MRLAANRGSLTVAQAMRPRWGKANGEEKGMTEPKRRTLDPSKWRAASQEDLDRIYGSSGLSIVSPVRPRRTPDEPEAAEQPLKPEDGERATHE